MRDPISKTKQKPNAQTKSPCAVLFTLAKDNLFYPGMGTLSTHGTRLGLVHVAFHLKLSLQNFWSRCRNLIKLAQGTWPVESWFWCFPDLRMSANCLFYHPSPGQPSFVIMFVTMNTPESLCQHVNAGLLYVPEIQILYLY